MSTPLNLHHKQAIVQAIGSAKSGADLAAIVTAKAGTLKPSTRRRMDLLCGNELVSRRICDIIDAATGTIIPSDRHALIVGIGDQGLGSTLADAIDGI